MMPHMNEDREAKHYYMYKERYDWVVDPERFEKIYHRLRLRLFLKNPFFCFEKRGEEYG